MHALPQGSTVAVIGSGAMGSGIAQTAAMAGHQVLLYDTRPEAAAKAIESICIAYSKLVEKGRMGAAESDLASERLKAIASLQEAKDALALMSRTISPRFDARSPASLM